MCTVCGCSSTKENSRLITIEQDILSNNNHRATENRRQLQAKNIFTLNLVSSPGTGKTSLLVRTLNDLKNDLDFFVIEGDQQSQRDADRIRATGVHAEQINTGKGCHLDASMIEDALQRLPIKNDAILFIENVGNLICPAAFDLGEDITVAMLSVTEGDDKPLKYPDIFQAADIVIITKIDLLPHVDFDMASCAENIKQINNRATLIELSSKTGEGLQPWYQLLQQAHSNTNTYINNATAPPQPAHPR